jgi:L-ascorbate metabolism protein UlaG (beta-lactamase superfamily)
MKEITWLGHAAFRANIEGITIFFDPWVKGNPLSPIKDAGEIKEADLVLVSHDHMDHGFSEGITICKNTGATFVGVFELTEIASREGVKKTVPGNLGGEVMIDEIKVFIAPAFHSCGAGTPCGFVVMASNFTIYHAGDTSFFSDMEWIGRSYKIDLALLPIGSCFTMGPKEAAWAVEKLLPKRVIPCHYNTFPFIRQDPSIFEKLVGKKSKVEILKPGETIKLD